MDAETRKAWVAALRSGDYPQDAGSLITKNGYCCLGVLCKVKGHKIEVRANYGGFGEEIEGSYVPSAWISETAQTKLALHNDGSCGYKKWTFLQIADFIESPDFEAML